MRWNNHIFRVPSGIIWLSSLFMGILASIPKILQLNITFTELAADASIAFLFSLFVWYINLSSLPRFSIVSMAKAKIIRKLAFSLLLGMVVMVILVLFHQLMFPRYSFSSMLMMYQFRGILINLTISMVVFFLYQNFDAQQVKLQMERLKSENIHAQYELLKQQIDPHFLFNSLNTLKSMIDIQDTDAGDFVVKLSDFYRFSLESTKEDVIPLSKETEVLEAYLFLLHSRYEDSIVVRLEIDEQSMRSFIPPFTLQLLVENCIKHNAFTKKKPLFIDIYTENDYLIVKNNYQFRENEQSAGVGLDNIKGRYGFITQQEVAVIKPESHFIVKLPLIYENTDHRR
ncbi:histidine kinase [Chitinophaga oryzae]|uniref:Histidine kinase n=1 Tax=Chitinophaga oryzae TaxID=2725414 RepID=A0AAE7D5J7_9BACT|nr:histidine kinase [Chitinophaga oryzae]QJB30149.1 histidine kinase [Chitinophaga oryzae]